jgi:MFS family permease
MAPRLGRRALSDQSAAVVALLIVLTVLAGCSNYSLPVYLQHLTADRGLPLSGVSAGASVFFLSGAIVGWPMGRVLMRVEPRTVMLAGGVVGGVALGFVGQASALWQLYVCYVGMGVAFNAAGALPGFTAVLRLAPPHQRARSLAIWSIGLSAGGFVLTPLAVVLIDHIGLSQATAVLGALWVTANGAAIALLMPRTRPPRRRHARLSDAIVDDGAPFDDATHVSSAEAMRSLTFWLLVVAFFLFLAAQIGSMTHLVRLAAERGMVRGAWLVPVVTACAVLARGIGSFALRHLSIWTLSCGVFAVEALATMTLAFAYSWAALFTGAALLGMAIGHTPLINPLLLVEAFGVREYPRIAAVHQLLAAVGLGAGPIVVSLVYGSTSGDWGGYRAGYLLLSGCSVMAVMVVRAVGQLASRPRVPHTACVQPT